MKVVDTQNQMVHPDCVRAVRRSRINTTVKKTTNDSSRSAKRTSKGAGGPRKAVRKAKPKKYQIRALGYCVEATAHGLSKDEVTLVERWCEAEGCTPDEITGNLEEALDGYNCYSTNLWQSGIVPIVDSVRLVLLDDEENEILTIAKPRSLVGGAATEHTLKTDRKDGNVLVYFEEYKGLVATWTLQSDSIPTAKDFSVDTDKIVVDGDETEFIDGVRFRGEELERDYDEEDIRGKAAYSVLL